MSIMDELLDIASQQHGYLTTVQAREKGIESQRLVQLASRGRLERVDYGIYLVPSLSPSIYSEFSRAVLWSNGGAVTGESSIMLWGLADVNPRKIHLAISKRLRREKPDNYVLHKMNLEYSDLDDINGVVSTNPRIAFEVAIDNGTAAHLIRQGIDKAQAQELFGYETAAFLRVRLIERDKRGKK